MYIAAIGTAWLLLGSPRYNQAMLELFQKHSCVGSIFIAPVTVSVFETHIKAWWWWLRNACLLALQLSDMFDSW
jgi:hypothetical protein